MSTSITVCSANDDCKSCLDNYQRALFFFFKGNVCSVKWSDEAVQPDAFFSAHDQNTRKLPAAACSTVYLVLMMITGLNLSEWQTHPVIAFVPPLQDLPSCPFSILWPALRLCGHAVGLYNCGPEWRADSGWLNLPLVTFSHSKVSAWKQSFVPGADRSPTVCVPLGIPP